MKIAVFTPRDHFHTPIILRQLAVLRHSMATEWRMGGQGDANEVLAVTTPKLSRRDGSVFTELVRIVRTSGADYLISAALTKICYIMCGLVERYILFVPFNQRRFISVSETLRHFGIRRLDARRINSAETISVLREFKPDIIIAVFFNQIIGPEIINLPAYGAVNVHPSYLPAYRGFSPCFWVLANNEPYTGISFHSLTRGIDDGPILWQEQIPINSQDTFFSVYRRCAVKAAELLRQVLDKVKRGEPGSPQEQSKSSYFNVITAGAVRQFRRQHRRFGWII